jgi:DMSO/TMAO reductase YedYZ molybdopterin-dependent catalytic subunit
VAESVTVGRTRNRLIARQLEPDNLEMPFDLLDGYLTPTELFYVRSHFPAPRIDAADYRLSVRGAVARELSLSLAELRALPSRSIVATLECAGNSRMFLSPTAPGVQWELGAVGNAEWTGVPLSAVLERAGLGDAACELVLAGADRGMPKEEPRPPADIRYARSLPRGRALESDVLLAWAMNGEDLTVEHGHPLRAVVPGHYGMASVKWLTEIVAVTQPFQGYWQTVDYGYWDDSAGDPVRRPLGAMKLKAQIARPAVHERVAIGRPYTVVGAAWAGDTAVAGVEVSVDGGTTWAKTEFLDPVSGHAWRRWTYEWTPSRPGRHILMARAAGADRRVQPGSHDPRHGSYVVDHVLPIEVLVV